jgi:hypothetical protein
LSAISALSTFGWGPARLLSRWMCNRYDENPAVRHSCTRRSTISLICCGNFLFSGNCFI